MRELITLFIGLLLLGVLAFFCVNSHRGSIEADLIARSTAALGEAQIEGLAVTAEGRDLLVRGEVKNQAIENRAMSVVGATYGVRTVAGRIQVKPGPTLADCTLTATTQGKGLSLVGIAPAAATLQTVRSGTQRTLDTQTVEIADLADHPAMGAGMAAALPWLHRFSESKAVATPTSVVITGKTSDPTLAEAALLSLLDGTPDGFNTGVEIDPGRTFGPEELMVMVRPRANGAVLSGIVATDVQRAALLKRARKLFKGPVASSLLVAGIDGVDFTAGVEAGTPVVQTLSNGRLQLTPMRFFLSGLTPGGATFDTSQLDALRTALPDGAELATDITTPLSQDSCQQALNDRLSKEKIQFETAKAGIKPASDPLLIAIASTLRRCPGAHLAIQGHTDSQGDDAMNLDLSNRRSGAVYNRLMRLGMPSTRATASGFGETRPIADNQTDAGRAQNRRIEFRLEETTP